ncbi:MAG: late competence development ComFB family protein [Spirochaetes bacterium]|nr:late competence development ComFB family protein [Spirochaetota bacterium]
MAIKNLMMDIVTSAVHEVMKNDRSVKDSGANDEDIIAYVLNRVPPKYITSERGILHGALDVKYMVQQRMDVLTLIYDAVNEIKRRRSSKAISKEEGEIDRIRLPHIIGTVLEETTLTIIPDVEVALLYKGKIAEMLYDEWENPYRSHKATMGYYHFWPKYNKKSMGDTPTFTLRFRHPKFNEMTADAMLQPLGKDDEGGSHVVPIVLMTAKDGVSLDFLYEE